MNRRASLVTAWLLNALSGTAPAAPASQQASLDAAWDALLATWRPRPLGVK